jgi:hypothetical protein
MTFLLADINGLWNIVYCTYMGCECVSKSGNFSIASQSPEQCTLIKVEVKKNARYNK